MLLELMATIFAGLGAAGLALFGRLITAQRLPRWTIPAFAGAGMLGFQIYSEYTWFEHQQSLLPKGVLVAKAIPETKMWKPWTLAYPQTSRFIALDTNSIAANKINPELMLADIYLFERRRSAQRLPQVFHCRQQARANLTMDLQIPAPGERLDNQWLQLAGDDPLLNLACANHGAAQTEQQTRVE